MINSRMPLNNKALNFNHIQDGGRKPPPTPNQFSPVFSKNLKISLKNFLTFSFNPLATLM